jgi:hypothetical protein
MKSSRSKSSSTSDASSQPRLSKDAERLVSLATAAADSGSIVELRYWHAAIERLAAQLLDRGNDSALHTALNHTLELDRVVHDTLADASDGAIESMIVTDEAGASFQALFVAIPFIAWSRQLIAVGDLKEDALAPIRAHFYAHILAPDVQTCIAPRLYSVEELPDGLGETRKFARKLAHAALKQSTPRLDALPQEPPLDMATDTRFLLASVVAPLGAPVFRWQLLSGGAQETTREKCLEIWRKQCAPSLAKLVPGTEIECLLPDGFLQAMRNADARIRPYLLTSSISFIRDQIRNEEAEVGVVIGAVGETRVDEYRISFLKQGENDVLHGMVWPLVGDEDDDDSPGPRDLIDEVLRQLRVTEITRLTGLFAPEFCDDCGAPLFFDHEGEAVHAALPDDADLPASHVH